MAKDETAKEQQQTWVLKVYVHCEGCKSKIKRILQKVKGVSSVTVDMENHKVTVEGTADADSLIKQLAKRNKKAELWLPPQAAPAPPKPAIVTPKTAADGETAKPEEDAKPKKDKKKKKSVQFQEGPDAKPPTADAAAPPAAEESKPKAKEPEPERAPAPENSPEKTPEAEEPAKPAKSEDEPAKKSKKKGKKAAPATEQPDAAGEAAAAPPAPAPAETCAAEVRNEPAGIESSSPAILVMHNRSHSPVMQTHTYAFHDEVVPTAQPYMYYDAPHGPTSSSSSSSYVYEGGQVYAYDSAHVAQSYPYMGHQPYGYEYPMEGNAPRGYGGSTSYADDYATTLFSDENTNSCSVM